MKAIDYYNEYGEAVFAESIDANKTEAINKLFMAFLHETKEIIAMRNVKTDKGAVAVIKEQNQKWNALCSIFEKRSGGMCPLRHNGFMNAMKNEIPELSKRLGEEARS